MTLSRWILLAAASAGAVVLVAGAVVAVSMRRWDHETEQLVRELSGPEHEPARGVVSFAAFASLPAPVARYFRTVLRDGQPYVRAVRVAQGGEFNMSWPADGWRPLDAMQSYSVLPPGYVWDASVHMAPLGSVRVRDAYVRGHGSTRGAVLSLVPVVDGHGRRELDEGAMQRYLAETPWFPTALLPGQGVTWDAVDDTHARATVTDGVTTVSLVFEFAASGEAVAVSTPTRFRPEKGVYVAAPWGGTYARYEERGGMRVPLEAEVYWTMNGRDEPYIRIRVTGMQHEFAT